MKFLYGIKNCSKCAKRRTCKLKNNPSNLSDKPLVFDITNRGLTRHPRKAGDITVKIHSFCKDFYPEEKE